MENELFLNAGSRAAAMPIWPLAMEIQAANEMNCSSEQSSDCFFNPNNWEKSTDLSLQFHSALSSMVSSPVASNSNIFNEISPHALAPHNINGNNSNKTSCYTTPLNSPPKMDHFVKEPRLANSMALNSSVADFSADPGFAERAARFSLFGSRNFNGRTGQFVPNNNPEFGIRSNPLMANEKLPRVVSSPSLKLLGSQRNQNSSELANSQEETSVSEQVPNGDAALKTSNVFDSKKRKAVSKGKGKEPIASPSSKVAESNDNSHNKRCKPNEGNANENGAIKAGEEPKGDAKNAGDDEQARATNPPEPPKDYIHVRARRGQATDSHSLAERVRREKISERMKFLQDLVPGCNKVTGKALMLDEIINYVRSLQQKVEFLSMKLASVNTRLDFNVDALMSKDVYHPNKPLPHSVFPIDSSASAFFGHQPQQNPALHSNISNETMTQCPVDPLDIAICGNLNMQLPQLDQFTEIIPQFPNFCQNDLQSLVQIGFGQNPSHETSLLSQSFHGSNQASHLKVEL